MSQDQIFEFKDHDGANLKVIPVALNYDEEIYLLHIVEENSVLKKKFIRNDLILVGDTLLTSSFSDSVHFMEELNLFDHGNDQNKYLAISEYQSTKNLKLKHDGERNVFISKSQAKAMYKIFNLAFKGCSIVTVLENEFRLTPQLLTQLLQNIQLLEKE